MKKLGEQLLRTCATDTSKFVRQFRDDETGSMTVFTMFILVLMLVVAGMAVDFMRFESRRTIMQGAVDRAVLAAADLDQVRDPADVVRDYVSKSQGGNCLADDPSVTPSANFRSVTANCELEMSTYFLRILGIKNLTALASATAIEGVGNVEVSLVVDISGSMSRFVPSVGKSRIDLLEDAGIAFVDTLLQNEYEDRISVSLVPYTAHVNAGPDLFDATGTPRKHWFSHCIDIPDSEFTNAAWNGGIEYQQGHHFWFRTGDPTGCPTEEYEQIIPISQDKDALKDAIREMQPRSTTSIFLGLKWGAALLDPSFQSIYSALPSDMSDAAFAGRPESYGNNNTPSDTKKYIVVMTDGENWPTNVLHDFAYDSPSEVAQWSFHGLHDMYYEELGRNYTRYREFYYEKYSAAKGDILTDQICTAAKNEGVIIFAIAMGAPEPGQQAMSSCASSPGHYFETSGDELVAIFEAIADQITDLRLTL